VGPHYASLEIDGAPAQAQSLARKPEASVGSAQPERFLEHAGGPLQEAVDSSVS